MDLNDIINTLIAEANGEGPEGMRRVGETILNRAAIRGIDPAAVVRQPAQYTGYSAPGPAAVAAQQDPRVRSAAEAAWELARQPGDPTDGADHYFNPNLVDPGWQNSMQSTGDYGDHTFYRSRPVPADALAALLTPQAPIPQMPPARGNVPSNLIADSFASLPTLSRTLGDNLALNPVGGGRQQAPLFDAAYDERTGQMRLTREPIDSQGVAFGRSREPAPTPAIQSAHLAGQRNRNPTLQAALDALYPARPQISASDMARGRSGISTIASIPTTGIGQPPATRTVASVPVPAPSQQSAPRVDPVGAVPKFNDIAAMFGPAVPGPNGYSSDNKAQDRLGPTLGAYANMPGTQWFAPPTPRPRDEADAARGAKPAMKTIIEQVPNPDWTADLATTHVPAGMKVNFGSRDSVAQRQAGVTAAKSIPQFITRTRQVPATPTPAAVVPKRAPVPFSRPAAPAARAPLRIVVNGGNVQPAPAPSASTWAPQGYTNDGTGKITSNETGGVYYERHLR